MQAGAQKQGSSPHSASLASRALDSSSVTLTRKGQKRPAYTPINSWNARSS
jgi:hypothetical protein